MKMRTAPRSGTLCARSSANSLKNGVASPVVRPSVRPAQATASVDYQALESAVRVAVTLKRQLKREQERAASVVDELKTVHGRYDEAEFEQAQQIRKEREVAKEACLAAIMQLEGEKRRIEKLKAEAASDGGVDILLVEQRARNMAENLARDLERKLAEASRRAHAEPDNAPTSSSLVTRELTVFDEMVEKAQQMNTLLLSQLQGEKNRASSADELAAKRQRDLEAMSLQLSSLEKTGKMLLQDVTKAEDNSKAAKEELESYGRRNFAAELKEAKAKAAEADRVKEMMLETKRRIAAQLGMFENVMSDAGQLDKLRSSLDQMIAANDTLTKQVVAEGSRASEANRKLAHFQAFIKEEGKNRELLEEERSRKEAVLAAMEAAKKAVEEEEKRTQKIIEESKPALAELEAARTSKSMVLALADELEAKLQVAKAELEERIVSASRAAKSEEQLEAESVVASLTRQLKSECERVGMAKDLAASKQKELVVAQEKLRDTLYRLKTMSKAAKVAIMAVRDIEANGVDLSSTRPTLYGPAQQELFSKIKAETKRADALEREAESLRMEVQEIQRAQQDTMAAVSASGVSQEEAEYYETQSQLALIRAESEELKKLVLAEGQKAASSSRDLYTAHNRVREVEGMMQSLRVEVGNMKGYMSDLEQQLRDVLACKSERMAEREAEKEAAIAKTMAELKHSQQQVEAVRKDVSDIASALEASQQRVEQLEIQLRDHYANAKA